MKTKKQKGKTGRQKNSKGKENIIINKNAVIS